MGKRDYKYASSGIIDIATTFNYFYTRLCMIAMSCFHWDGLPDTVDERFLEKTLLFNSNIVFFRDDVVGYAALRAALSGELDIYEIPMEREIYSTSGFQARRNSDDSVIIYDNYMHMSIIPTLRMFAQRLTNLEVTKDINLRSQKTPILIQCEKNEQLSMENLFLKYDSGSPVIYGSKNLDLSNIKVLNLQCPYIGKELQEQKIAILQEAFSFLGIGGLEIEKRERLIRRELQESQQANIMQRQSRLRARMEGCEKINNMFGLDLSVHYCNEATHMADDFLKEGDNYD